jgi:hypothetical protein
MEKHYDVAALTKATPENARKQEISKVMKNIGDEIRRKLKADGENKTFSIGEALDIINQTIKDNYKIYLHKACEDLYKTEITIEYFEKTLINNSQVKALFKAIQEEYNNPLDSVMTKKYATNYLLDKLRKQEQDFQGELDALYVQSKDKEVNLGEVKLITNKIEEIEKKLQQLTLIKSINKELIKNVMMINPVKGEDIILTTTKQNRIVAVIKSVGNDFWIIEGEKKQKIPRGDFRGINCGRDTQTEKSGVSRNHANITHLKGRLLIKDISTNGTMIRCDKVYDY